MIRRIYPKLKAYFRRLFSINGPQSITKEHQEDFLKALYHRGGELQADTAYELSDLLHISPSQLSHLIGASILSGDITGLPIRLTEQGREKTLKLIRAHRIYEQYLAEHSGYKPEEWHTKAHRMEHKISPEEEERITALLRNPLYDPHGDPIPTPTLDIPQKPQEEIPLFHANQWLKVLHVEDDDILLFRLIESVGLTRGSIIRVVDYQERQSLSFVYEQEFFTLPIEALGALNLTEVSTEEIEGNDRLSAYRLTRLQLGQEATIVDLSSSCRGAMRRRLMDLGFVRGSKVSIDMKSPLGNPIAYVVRGSAIALRHDQAKYILVTTNTEHQD